MSDDAAPQASDASDPGRSPVDHLVDEILDRFLYAPVALMASPDDVRVLADKGRTLIRNQTTMARFIGQIAVTSATRKVKARLDEQRSSNPSGAAPVDADAVTHDATPSPTPARSDATREPAKASATSKAPATSKAARSLPIDGYDTLAASQIVPLLSGLSSKQLDAVEAHELSGRNRKTVLNRINQLR
ncbi:MAG: hypothetical protein AB7V43_18800 [Acidimicrobiia bacterium]